MKLFISYSSRNVDQVKLLHVELEKYGFNILRDKQFIKAGQQFDEEIEQRIRDCDVVLFIASINAMASKWVRAEVDFAFDLDKPIIPLRLDEEHELPWYMRHTHYHPMTTSAEWDRNLGLLVEELSHRKATLISDPEPPSIEIPSPIVGSSVSTKPSEPDFVAGSRIEPEIFVGRTDVLNEITKWIGGNQLQSISIVGNRRIGKSSLLWYLTNRFETVLPPKNWVMAYLDMMAVKSVKSAMFLIRQQLEIKLPPQLHGHLWEKSDDNDTVYLVHLANQARNSGIKLVFLIDEVESLLARPELNDLVEVLRSLGQQSLIAMITASAYPLVRLNRVHGVTSPFFNIFKTHYIGLLSNTQWINLVQSAYKRADHEIEDIDIDLIGDLAGSHPYFTQLAGSVVWKGRREGISTEAIRDDFVRQAEPNFDTLWSHQTVPNQSTALAQYIGVAVRKPLEETPLKEAIHELTLRGVINGRGQIFSKPFENYVYQQAKRYAEGE